MQEIKIVNYDGNWIAAFETEKSNLFALLGDKRQLSSMWEAHPFPAKRPSRLSIYSSAQTHCNRWRFTNRSLIPIAIAMSIRA